MSLSNYMSFSVPDNLPYISDLLTYPSLNTTPAYNQKVLDYYARVPYHTLLIRVHGIAMHCDVEVRLDNKHGPSKPSNYTLGLGTNSIVLHVVDVSHSTPWILCTYTLHVYREEPGKQLGTFHSQQPHSVCSLKQV